MTAKYAETADTLTVKNVTGKTKVVKSQSIALLVLDLRRQRNENINYYISGVYDVMRLD